MSNDTLFRKSSLNSISSPDQLNDYIEVSNPSVWLVMAALFVLLAAVLVWGVTGSIPTTINAKGVACEGQIVCYINIDDASEAEIGQQASITSRDSSTYKGQISEIEDIPMSAAEITSALNSEYLAYELVSGQFAVKISVVPNTSGLADGTLLDIRIVTDTVRPIDFLLGR